MRQADGDECGRGAVGRRAGGAGGIAPDHLDAFGVGRRRWQRVRCEVGDVRIHREVRRIPLMGRIAENDSAIVVVVPRESVRAVERLSGTLSRRSAAGAVALGCCRRMSSGRRA